MQNDHLGTNKIGKLGKSGSRQNHATYFWNFETISWELWKLGSSPAAQDQRSYVTEIEVFYVFNRLRPKLLAYIAYPIKEKDNKLIRKWDSERELPLRHR